MPLNPANLFTPDVSVQQANQGIDKVSTVLGGFTLSGWVFSNGIHKPEHSSILTEMYPQYTMTYLLDKLAGRFNPIAQEGWSWSEIGRTREKRTISAVTAGIGTPIVTVTITPSANQYFLPNDVVIVTDNTGANFGLPIMGIILTSTASTLTIQKLDPTNTAPNWTAPIVAANFNIGHLYSAFQEYSLGPNGRMYLPFTRNNKLTMMRRSIQVSGTELTNRSYVSKNGEGPWFFELERLNMNEFARDQEIAIMFGQRSLDGQTFTLASGTEYINMGDGILTTVNNGGQFYGYSGPLDEDDIQDFLTTLGYQAPTKEWLVLAGGQYCADFRRAMRDYVIRGGYTFGSVDSADLMGLAMSQYKFGERTITVVEYNLFNDDVALPQQTANINYRNFALWLNMGDDEKGQPLISLKYKKLGNLSYKFIHEYIKGFGTSGFQGSETTIQTSNIIATSRNGLDIQLGCEIGAEVRNSHWHGIQRRTA